MAAVANIPFVRADDPLFERVIATRFAHIDVVLTVRPPNLGDRLASAIGIGFDPDGDVPIGKMLRIVHDTSPFGWVVQPGLMGRKGRLPWCENGAGQPPGSMTSEVKKRLAHLR